MNRILKQDMWQSKDALKSLLNFLKNTMLTSFNLALFEWSNYKYLTRAVCTTIFPVEIPQTNSMLMLIESGKALGVLVFTWFSQSLCFNFVLTPERLSGWVNKQQSRKKTITDGSNWQIKYDYKGRISLYAGRVLFSFQPPPFAFNVHFAYRLFSVLRKNCFECSCAFHITRWYERVNECLAPINCLWLQ